MNIDHGINKLRMRSKGVDTLSQCSQILQAPGGKDMLYELSSLIASSFIPQQLGMGTLMNVRSARFTTDTIGDSITRGRTDLKHLFDNVAILLFAAHRLAWLLLSHRILPFPSKRMVI
jgi:hypothetical protein